MSKTNKIGFTCVLALATALAFILAGGCEQSVGDFCQINADCATGLTCNPATQKCQEPGSSVIDAAPDAPIDAPPIDAPVIDAAPDAPIDAPL